MSAEATQDKPLRPYMCFVGDPLDGAILAFAHSAQHARKLAYPNLSEFSDRGFIDVRARLLFDHPEYYQSLKLQDVPHINEYPPVCEVCGTWGFPQMACGNGCLGCGGR